MSKQRIIFMGSPDFSIPALDALHQHHNVVAVYSQPPRKSGRGMEEQLMPVARHAATLGLETHWPDTLKDAETQDSLAAFNADLFVVVAYGLLLPQSVLDMPRLGCVNGHASLLPRWRGAAPIQRAIEAGDAESGISAMLMEAGLDTGPVLAVSHLIMDNRETAGSLHDKLAAMNAKLLLHTVDNMPDILDQKTVQNEDAATYASKISAAEAQIDWHKGAIALDRHIRAFSPFPGAWFMGPKGRIKITEAAVETDGVGQNDRGTYEPGTFLGSADDGAMRIMTGHGILKVMRLQPAGKKPMHASDFLNGQVMDIGTILPRLEDGPN